MRYGVDWGASEARRPNVPRTTRGRVIRGTLGSVYENETWVGPVDQRFEDQSRTHVQYVKFEDLGGQCPLFDFDDLSLPELPD